MRPQGGDDVGAARFLQFGLARAAVVLGGGQGAVGRLARGGGLPRGAPGGGRAGQQGPQVAEVAVRLNERRLRRGGEIGRASCRERV